MHTFLGMHIYVSAIKLSNKAAVIIKKYEKVLKDEDNQNEFIDKYN